jgi:hypothetical protein
VQQEVSTWAEISMGYAAVVTFAMVGLLSKLKFGRKVDMSIGELLSTVDDTAGSSVMTTPPRLSQTIKEADAVAAGAQHAVHRAAALQAAHAKGGGHVD